MTKYDNFHKFQKMFPHKTSKVNTLVVSTQNIKGKQIGGVHTKHQRQTHWWNNLLDQYSRIIDIFRLVILLIKRYREQSILI